MYVFTLLVVTAGRLRRARSFPAHPAVSAVSQSTEKGRSGAARQLPLSAWPGPSPAWLDLSYLTPDQSSTAEGGVAARAVDGNPNVLWDAGGCTLTNEEMNPFWSLTLPSKFKIALVRVTNRGDCCGEQLSGFTVLVDGFPCAQDVAIAQGQSKDVICLARGKNVTITVPRLETLSICEFSVLAAPPGADLRPWGFADLAGLQTQMSTVDGEAGAARAIDGNPFNMDPSSCMMTTSADPSPWWSVTLPRPSAIAAIRITNRGDCCGDSLSGFSVAVDDQPCAEGVFIWQGATIDVPCPAFGSVVKIAGPQPGVISLCEVWVVTADPSASLEPLPALPPIELPPP